MPIVDRRFTYRSYINVSSADLRLARSGAKTCTIRLGTINVSTERVFLTDRRDKVLVKILGVDRGRVYRQLTGEDAKRDGADSVDALGADLRKYYGAIDPEQPVTVVYFELCEP
jgi:hypothetical protein